ncbi:MarR family winged helix-turn-helix transcriptional regulator [Kribbia dieselivorans]|uniref:MarR family winged helix-turn-helix transcriptional regulator n=1 Tax=Kribbia dieselivorans TaxID=331526 RepID=UPI000837B6F6|nr:MarR family transcriptional regulator [Kribbia dieselivorans]
MAPRLPTALLMQIAARSAEDRIVEALRAAGFDDVTLAQGRLMAGIDVEGTRIGVLAARAQVSKQTATALLAKLERAGYAERIPDLDDGRATLIRPTARTLEAIEHARRQEAEIEADWSAHLGPRRMKQLREALEMLREITDPYFTPME